MGPLLRKIRGALDRRNSAQSAEEVAGLEVEVVPGSSSSLSRKLRLADVPGWFYWIDQQLFRHVLSLDDVASGTLLELGAYMGKSAIVLGQHLRDGEELVVCDLFGAAADSKENLEENRTSYEDLTRSRFEENYLAFHSDLPTIVQDLTSSIEAHVARDSCRFVHIDASHLYAHVAGDISASRRLLAPDGMVVLDDYRSQHTPGVAAAAWAAVANEGLNLVALSPSKMYATWGDPGSYRTSLELWGRSQSKVHGEVQQLLGQEVLRFWT